MRIDASLLSRLAAAMILGCSVWAAAHSAHDVREDRARDDALVALGARLFDDPALSDGGRIACSSCHMPSRSFSDGLVKSTGASGRQTGRNTPTLLAAASRTTFFWDGSVTDLAAAVQRPLFDPDEMGNSSVDRLLVNIRQDRNYEADFEKAFGSPGMSLPRIGSALAAYIRSVDTSSRHSDLRNRKAKALTREQLRGLQIFEGKARCNACHAGAALTDEAFHNTGLSVFGETGADTGRYAVTGNMEDAGRFRTPSLRAVAQTAPYMHNGAFPDLDAVIRFYERGGGAPWVRNRAEETDPIARSMATVSLLLQSFTLTAEERTALIEFLKTL